MVHFLPPVLMGKATQQQQVVLCWDTRTQPCTPLVLGVCGGGEGGGCREGCEAPASILLWLFCPRLLVQMLVSWFPKHVHLIFCSSVYRSPDPPSVVSPTLPPPQPSSLAVTTATSDSTTTRDSDDCHIRFYYYKGQ